VKDAAGNVRPAEEGDYPYARYDKHVTVVRYDGIEYETIIRPTEHLTGWTKVRTVGVHGVSAVAER